MRRVVLTLLCAIAFFVAGAQNTIYSKYGVTMSAPLGFERNDGLSSKMDMDVFSAADMSALIGIMRDAQNNESHQSLLAKAGRPFGLSVASVKEIDLDGGPLHYITGTAGTIGVYSIPGTTEAVMVIMIGSAFDSASAVSFLATLAVQ